ncbi:MAG: CarD family transcriptional regulator [Acidobacteriia bacterium]|nr:CarD family transcriptional regulator [Terriglobia bacterium]
MACLLGESPMDFKHGDKVVYPNQGVGVIEQISYGMLNGRTVKYYTLRILSTGSRVMVPQTNVEAVGLRPLIRPAETSKVLSFLEKGRCTNHHDWKHRYKENSERMRTGSLMDVAAVLKSLLALSRTKPLSFREKKMLERAKQLLVSEMAVAKGTTETAIESSLMRALAKARLQLPTGTESPE